MSAPAGQNPLDCRERLIRAAAETFMNEGYRASIDQIAARAGVARQTVYNHFSCKEELFGEVANNAANNILVSLDLDKGGIRERLVRFGTTFRHRLIGDEGLAFFRTISAESPRLPDLGREFYDKGAGQMTRRLADFLAQAMEDGILRRDEPRFAAETLLAMLECGDRTRRLFGAPLLPASIEKARVARIIDCFLRAFASTPPKEIR